MQIVEELQRKAVEETRTVLTALAALPVPVVQAVPAAQAAPETPVVPAVPAALPVREPRVVPVARVREVLQTAQNLRIAACLILEFLPEV